MNKYLVLFAFCLSTFVLQAQTALTSNYIADDFSSSTEYMSGEGFKGIYWKTNSSLAYALNRSGNGVLSVSVEKGNNDWSAFAVQFGDNKGDGTGTPYTIDISGNSAYHFTIKQLSGSGAAIVSLMAEDINGNYINLNQMVANFYNAFPYMINANISVGQIVEFTAGVKNANNNTLSGEFINGASLDWMTNTVHQNYDLTKIRGFIIGIDNTTSGAPFSGTFEISKFSVGVPLMTVSATTSSSQLFSGETATLDVAVHNGVAPYSYTWSNGLTGSTVEVTPSVSSTYTITVQDSYAATATASVAVNVFSCSGQTDFIAKGDYTGTSDQYGSTITASPKQGAELKADYLLKNVPSDYTYWPWVYINGLPSDAAFSFVDMCAVQIRYKSDHDFLLTLKQPGLSEFGVGFQVELPSRTTYHTLTFLLSDFAQPTWAEPGQKQTLDLSLITGITIESRPNMTSAQFVGNISVTELSLKGIETYPPLQVSLTTGESICAGEEAAITATVTGGAGVNTFSWSPIISQDSVIAVSPQSTTTYTVTVLDNDGNTATASTVVTVNQKPSIATQPQSATLCKNEALALSVGASGFGDLNYQWYLNGDSVGTNSATYAKSSVSAAEAGSYQCAVQNICGTVLSQTATIQVESIPTAGITVSGLTTFCAGDSVILYAPASEEYNYIWRNNSSTLAGESNSYLIVKTSGNYTVVVQDKNSLCAATSTARAVTVNTTSFGVAFAADQQLIKTAPFAVQFTNSTPDKASLTFKWEFGDQGISTSSNPVVFHQYQYNGLYDVTLTATSKTTGCKQSLYENGYIFCAAPGSDNPCNLSAAIIRVGNTSNICAGDSLQLVANATTGATLQWTLNNVFINGATTQAIYAKQPGEYRLIATLQTCTTTSAATLINQYPLSSPVVNATGTLHTCSQDSVNLDVSTYFPSYSWSDGQTGRSIYVNTSGTYKVTVTDMYGCLYTSAPVTLSVDALASAELCIVYVDTLTNKNKVVWNRVEDAGIESYNIYKESNQGNVYVKIGNVLYTQPNTFIDQSSSPKVHADRYKISAVDTCGNESALSAHHRTLHLSVSPNGMGQGYQLNWQDSYEGFDFFSYYIYRGTNKANLQVIDTIQNTLTSYTDLIQIEDSIIYMVAAVKPDAPCEISRPAKGVIPIEFKGAAYSNVSDEFGVIENIQARVTSSFDIYPNPVSNDLTIQASAELLPVAYTYQITDMIGQVLIQGANATDAQYRIYVGALSPAAYFLQIKTANASQTVKFIKVK